MILSTLFAVRVKNTLSHIGPPVLYGGISTFLAFAMLAASDSYVFIAFFQVSGGIHGNLSGSYVIGHIAIGYWAESHNLCIYRETTKAMLII